MKKKTIMTALSLIAVSVLSLCGQVKSTITVVDEEGQPIQGAEVLFSYVNFKNEENLTVATNEKGVAESKGSAELRVNLRVSKEGYYDTRYDKSEGTSLRKDENHHLRVVLRKVEKPIAMFARKVFIGVPEENKWFGYDLEIGDLVGPEGQGKQIDFLLKIDAVKTLPNGSVDPKSGVGKFWIKFPNSHEGLLYEEKGFSARSQMKMPHAAPKNGYLNSLEREEKSYHNQLAQKNVGMFLRLRVTESEQGEIEYANYAKITSDIYFDPRMTGWHRSDAGKETIYGGIRFTYYFNPTPNDRNLEFDTERNLFKNLPHNEQVRKP